MKKIIGFFTILCITAFTSQLINAQVNVSDQIQSIASQLENSDLEDIESATKAVDQANQMMEELVEEDKRIEKYFKKKEKKGEKKSVDAKIYRIDASNLYYDGLSTVHDVLAKRLSFAIFEYPQDQAKVEDLKRQAADMVSTVKENLISFQGLSKKDLIGLGYYTLISELESNVQMLLGAIDLLKDGYILWAAQAEKKQMDVEEENAWANAVNKNTIEAYQEYLSKYPKGKFKTEAENKIVELGEKARKADEEQRKRMEADAAVAEAARLAEIERQKREAELAAQQQVKEPEIRGLTYSVQIMAVYFKVDEEKLKTIYCGDKKIKERFEDGMYKYSIGEFESFNEAKEFRKTLKIPSFIIAFHNGERISTVDARKIENQTPEKTEGGGPMME